MDSKSNSIAPVEGTIPSSEEKGKGASVESTAKPDINEIGTSEPAVVGAYPDSPVEGKVGPPPGPPPMHPSLTTPPQCEYSFCSSK
jgi:hypothetical protein